MAEADSDGSQSFHRHRWLARGLALVLGMAAAALVTEVALRAAGVSAEVRGHFRPGVYVADDELGWGLRAGYAGEYLQDDRHTATRINELGYRGPPWGEARRAAPLRVLALGDSCTFGLGVEEAAAYPAQLEEILRARGRAAAVFNAGVPGYDSVQEAAAFARLVDTVRPEVVTIGWLRNDVQVDDEDTAAVSVRDGQLVEADEDFEEWQRRIEHQGVHASLAYRCLRVSLRRFKEAAGVQRSARAATEEIAPENMRRCQAALDRIVEGSRSRGARVVLVLMPRKEEVVNDDLPLRHHEAMRAWAEARGVTVVDLAPAWRTQGRGEGHYLLRDSVHLTPLGYESVARAIADALR